MAHFFCIPVKLVLDLIGKREYSVFNTFWIPAGVYPVLDTGRV